MNKEQERTVMSKIITKDDYVVEIRNLNCVHIKYDDLVIVVDPEELIDMMILDPDGNVPGTKD